MSSSLSSGTRAAQPNTGGGGGGGWVPDNEAGVQEDMRGPRQEPWLPRRPLLPSPPLSQQERRQIYFGVDEPVSPLTPGLGPASTAVGGLSLGELGPTCLRTEALNFTACVRVLAWLFVGT